MGQKNPLVYLYTKLWQYSFGTRKTVALYVLMFIVSETIDMLGIPILWSRVFDTVGKGGITASTLPTLQMLLGILVIRVFVVWALHGPARVIEQQNAFKVRLNYRRFLTQGILSLPLSWHTDHHSGDTIDKVSRGTSALYDFSDSSFRLIYCIITLIISMGMLTYFSYFAAVLSIFFMLVSGWITSQFDKVLVPRYKDINKRENKISESIVDIISNISTVIILRAEHLVFDRLMKQAEEPYALVSRTHRLEETKWFLTSLCSTLLIVSVLGLFFYQNYGALGGAILGSLYLLSSYVNRISGLLFEFCSMYGDLMKRTARLKNSEEVSSGFIGTASVEGELPENWQEISIKELNFSHQDSSDTLHLDDVNLTLKRGERVAFIGPTGCGKSTMLRVIRGLSESTTLKLSVDGVHVPNGFAGISGSIGLVPQSPEIFADTIKGNITLCDVTDDESDDEIRLVTDIAHFSGVIDSLPRGSKSVLKEKGVNLSGGEVQRLAVARGLHLCGKKRKIVLLDEPTSSLDPRTSRQVMGQIFTHYREQTIIVSLHQLNLLDMFHRIVYFKDGKVVAVGTKKELLGNSEAFRELWSNYVQDMDLGSLAQ